jgi:hypothetical protein
LKIPSKSPTPSEINTLQEELDSEKAKSKSQKGLFYENQKLHIHVKDLTKQLGFLKVDFEEIRVRGIALGFGIHNCKL